jgi:hypothetical protein
MNWESLLCDLSPCSAGGVDSVPYGFLAQLPPQVSRSVAVKILQPQIVHVFFGAPNHFKNVVYDVQIA